ncbi:flagellar hook-length control protein FliK [Aeromonas salmonicida]|uniref:flagellar hook-length control protein FliK n=1 Tax=Aeromonas salmonicida TaxID=645 RepID=UPI001F3F2574|nr:flagellar hook-length control protein FliK [Aeromonas salmonicida]MCE9934962.1 flagellar hook-length control protein FliK [Aeromonas salmonicida]
MMQTLLTNTPSASAAPSADKNASLISSSDKGDQSSQSELKGGFSEEMVKAQQADKATGARQGSKVAAGEQVAPDPLAKETVVTDKGEGRKHGDAKSLADTTGETAATDDKEKKMDEAESSASPIDFLQRLQDALKQDTSLVSPAVLNLAPAVEGDGNMLPQEDEATASAEALALDGKQTAPGEAALLAQQAASLLKGTDAGAAAANDETPATETVDGDTSAAMAAELKGDEKGKDTASADKGGKAALSDAERTALLSKVLPTEAVEKVAKGEGHNPVEADGSPKPAIPPMGHKEGAEKPSPLYAMNQAVPAQAGATRAFEEGLGRADSGTTTSIYTVDTSVAMAAELKGDEKGKDTASADKGGKAALSGVERTALLNKVLPTEAVEKVAKGEGNNPVEADGSSKSAIPPMGHKEGAEKPSPLHTMSQGLPAQAGASRAFEEGLGRAGSGTTTSIYTVDTSTAMAAQLKDDEKGKNTASTDKAELSGAERGALLSKVLPPEAVVKAPKGEGNKPAVPAQAGAARAFEEGLGRADSGTTTSTDAAQTQAVTEEGEQAKAAPAAKSDSQAVVSSMATAAQTTPVAHAAEPVLTAPQQALASSESQGPQASLNALSAGLKQMEASDAPKTKADVKLDVKQKVAELGRNSALGTESTTQDNNHSQQVQQNSQPQAVNNDSKPTTDISARRDPQHLAHLKLASPETPVQLHQKVNLMLTDKLQQAEIQLDPLGLGKMKIQIQMGVDNQANVHFVVQHGQTREMLEQAMPRLRDMLAGQGIQLGQTLVQQQPQQQSQGQSAFSGQGQSGQNGSGSFSETGQTEAEVTAAGSRLSMESTNDAGIDFYA